MVPCGYVIGSTNKGPYRTWQRCIEPAGFNCTDSTIVRAGSQEQSDPVPFFNELPVWIAGTDLPRCCSGLDGGRDGRSPPSGRWTGRAKSRPQPPIDMERDAIPRCCSHLSAVEMPRFEVFRIPLHGQDHRLLLDSTGRGDRSRYDLPSFGHVQTNRKRAVFAEVDLIPLRSSTAHRALQCRTPPTPHPCPN